VRVYGNGLYTDPPRFSTKGIVTPQFFPRQKTVKRCLFSGFFRFRVICRGQSLLYYYYVPLLLSGLSEPGLHILDRTGRKKKVMSELEIS
jgi:hypothetical protein